ncbi:hypothetical protein M422DRAFT_782185 [Sphaerobolus stellatus SS14]|uniref:Uncharacterized protein n=1 Tax=Sphaerobolus stellatus (strain SS14) TaxID=990650 RepID=A0A0C9VGD8_SPHS4|nr:hypothetical protein M422DRAFT_782185 [Sphaerobolus stellatus SS14]
MSGELSPGEPIRSNGSTSSFNSKAPPNFPTRTPARTKRRSTSSVLSVPSPSTPTFPNPPPTQDFVSALNSPAPIVFSTPLERELLNKLSELGFDTGQMVHSVLTDACDCSGALWWMMRKKAERRAVDEAAKQGDSRKDGLLAPPNHRSSLALSESSDSGGDLVNGTQVSSPVDITPPILPPAPPAPPPKPEPVPPPDLDIIPATPTFPPPAPRTPSPVLSPVLLSAQTPSNLHTRSSTTATPSSSTSSRNRGTKPRSASVSIMQRATTALEAAGLVRKKSDEKFRKEEQEKKDREEREKRAASAEEIRTSSNKLSKSPPSKPVKDGLPPAPAVEPSGLSGLPIPGSPWIMPPIALSPAESPTQSNASHAAPVPLPTPGSVGSATGKTRARASILHTFRMWFNEDRKGKRKAAANAHLPTHPPAPTPTSANSSRGGRNKRRSGSGSAGPRRPGHNKRASASSRRSSSVNSRRSSIASLQKIPSIDYPPQQHPSDDPFNPRRRSFGARTPTSERGEYSSRPSSIRSFQVSTPGLPPVRRSHSPSSSTGSGRRSIRRTDSPLQRYHRRAGSGSSTRVIRQIKTVHPPHVRSNSVSSNVSAPSSRPTSFHEGSESEGFGYPSTPSRPSSRQDSDDTPRRAPYSTTVLVAHKKTTPFRQPSAGRSSWKKAWGVEPPGWKSRSTEAPFEILFTDDPRTNVRDVFSGRPSLSQDDDEWVDDEDDEIPFAGGLGQMSSIASSSQSAPLANITEAFYKSEPLVLAPPPSRNARSNQGKRGGSRNMGRQKASHSPVSGSMPLPPPVEHPPADGRASRRQLPRVEPVFRQSAIQEEDEDEEEE